MEIFSADGDFVALTIDGYQFPDVSGSGTHDWDANWLTIAGFEHFVEFVLSPDELAVAADGLDTELQAFPVRP